MNILSLSLTLFLGFFILLGVELAESARLGKKVERIALCLAFGALLATVSTDLVPEIMESSENRLLTIALVFAGLLLLWGLDCFMPEHEKHGRHETEEDLGHIGVMAAIAITLHNLVEGMSVYSVFFQNFHSGLVLAVAIGLHNIPMGLLLGATLKHARRRKKFFYLFLAVFSTFLGGLLMSLLSSLMSDAFVSGLISLALGMVLYIAFFELLGEIRAYPKKVHLAFWSLLGFFLVFFSAFLG